jgi:glucokinase
MTHTSSPLFSIGVDFGGTTIKSAVVADGRIIARGATIETHKLTGPAMLIDTLTEELIRLKNEHPAVRAVGVGLPGIVDSVHGMVHQLTNVPGWKEIPFRDIMREKTGIPFSIENDANAMAYGEWKYGAARNQQNVVCVTLGTGVGGGLILNGQLYRGSQLAAGEIGNMSIDYKGVDGPYGNYGAMERYVGSFTMKRASLLQKPIPHRLRSPWQRTMAIQLPAPFGWRSECRLARRFPMSYGF